MTAVFEIRSFRAKSTPRRALLLFAVAGILLSACTHRSAERVSVSNRAIARDVVAEVGGTPIPFETLRRARIAATGSTSTTLTQLIETRLYGLYATNEGLQPGRRNTVARAVLARALLERIEAASKTPPSPTDAEVAAMTERHWIELDRPEAVRTCHAVVRRDKTDEVRAAAFAQRLQESLRSITACSTFVERAKGFTGDGFKVTAEDLPPVTVEGRTVILDSKGAPVQEGPLFDVTFARAAHAIKLIGNQSGVVRTSFGWHIILLEDRLAAKQVSLEERRKLLADQILSERARKATEDRLAEAHQATTIAVERAAIEAIGRVQVGP